MPSFEQANQDNENFSNPNRVNFTETTSSTSTPDSQEDLDDEPEPDDEPYDDGLDLPEEPEKPTKSTPPADDLDFSADEVKTLQQRAENFTDLKPKPPLAKELKPAAEGDLIIPSRTQEETAAENLETTATAKNETTPDTNATNQEETGGFPDANLSVSQEVLVEDIADLSAAGSTEEPTELSEEIANLESATDSSEQAPINQEKANAGERLAQARAKVTQLENQLKQLRRENAPLEDRLKIREQLKTAKKEQRKAFVDNILNTVVEFVASLNYLIQENTAEFTNGLKNIGKKVGEIEQHMVDRVRGISQRGQEALAAFIKRRQETLNRWRESYQDAKANYYRNRYEVVFNKLISTRREHFNLDLEIQKIDSRLNQLDLQAGLNNQMFDAKSAATLNKAIDKVRNQQENLRAKLFDQRQDLIDEEEELALKSQALIDRAGMTIQEHQTNINDLDRIITGIRSQENDDQLQKAA